MKKILALVLSSLMVFTFIPVAMSASADAEYTRVLNNFDDIGRLNGSVEWINGSTNKSATVIDYTEIDPTYTDGKVLKIVPYSSNGNMAIPVDPSWALGNPIGIKFQVWAETSGTFDTERTGLTDTASSVTCKMSVLGANPTGTRNLSMSTTPEWYVYDLTVFTKTTLKLVFNSAANFYIDNITLIYANEEDVPADLSSEYKTAYDWETDTTGVSKVGSTTFARNTAAAYSGIADSTYGLKVVGTYNKTASYMQVVMTDELKAAASIRVPMLMAVSSSSNPTNIGVQIDGVNYWYMYGNSVTTMSYQYFDYKTFTAADGSTVVMQRDYSKVTALLFSFGNSYSNFYVDDIQYAGLITSSSTPTETDGETTDAIATADKASIRLNEVNGMRFYTTVDTEKLAALGTVTEMGTLIGPKNKIGDYLTMDDATAENAVAVEYGVDNDLWEGNEFVGSIVNVKDTNLNREFVARGYVKVGDTYYYSSTTSTRTLAGVADSCIADTDYYSTLDAATQALVNTWAAAND